MTAGRLFSGMHGLDRQGIECIEMDNTVMNLCSIDGILLTLSLGSDHFEAYLQG